MPTMKRALLLVLLIARSSAASGDDLEQADLARLLDPAARAGEVARLAGCDGKKRLLRSFRLHRTPRAAGGEWLVLAASYDFHFESDQAPWHSYKIDKPEELFGGRAPAAELLDPELSRIDDHGLQVFGPDGKEVRPFGGNNWISGGYLFDLNRDGVLDRADSTSHRVTGADDQEIEVFELETVEIPSRSLLRVVFNWHPRRAGEVDDWTFTCEDMDGDGVAEITFGPKNARSDEDRRRFVFRWDPVLKAYSAGEIPDRSHIRVLEEGENLAQLAQSGGLGYPVTSGGATAVAAAPAAAPVRPATTYAFASLKGSSDREVLDFFRGKARPDAFRGPEDAVRTGLPDGFWEMDPKQAALAFAEANRTPAHRQRWHLALDDRGGIAPPKSGWLLHDWGSSGCYSYSSHIFALRFGVAEPGLLATEYNSSGVVGANPLVDQPGHSARRIALSDPEARFLADTVFWLDRIRALSIVKEDDHRGISSSSADGYGSLHLLADDAAPRKVAAGTVWADRSVGANWTGTYTPGVCLNLVEFLLADALPARLGKRWQVAPEIDHRGLSTPLEQRLKPRHDLTDRDLLTGVIAEALQRHATDPLPAPALGQLVRCAGEEALLDLRPALERLQATLPPRSEEDDEFEVLQTRFARDHFGTPTADEPSDHPKDHARYEALREKRELQPGPVLRDPLAAALEKLRIARSPEQLLKQVRDNGDLARWALGRLRMQYPDLWADYLVDEFQNANPDERRALFDTLAAARPESAKDLIALLDPKEIDALALEIAAFQLRHDAAAAMERVPVLLQLVRERKADYLRRGEAMRLLGSMKLDPPAAAELLGLLVAEIKDPQKGDFAATHTSAAALDAVSRLPGAAAHLDEIAGTTGGGFSGFASGIDALLRLTRDSPDRNAPLERFVRARLKRHDGMMNEVFFAALALDLRGLAPEIAAMASESPAVPDGDGAEYGGGHFKGPGGERYHIAREITALWSEPDPATRARMWLAMVLHRPYHFSPEYHASDAAAALRERATAAIRELPPEPRHQALLAMSAATPSFAGEAEVAAWLHAAAELPAAAAAE
jgi:hypothetical protein